MGLFTRFFKIFSSSVLWRLFTGYGLIIVITTSIVGIQISQQISHNSLSHIHESLQVRGALLEEIARHQFASNPDDADFWQTAIIRLSESTQGRLTIINHDGVVLADSQEHQAVMDNHAHRPEIKDALSNGKGMATRFSQTLGKKMVYHARAVYENNALMGYVRVSLPLTTVDKKLEEIRGIVFLGAGTSVFIALLVGFYFAKRFTAPVKRMTDIAEKISQGDYNRRIAIQQRDEIGKLASAFNRMARSSARRMGEITADRNRLAMIFAGMVEGIVYVEQDQKIIHMNQAASKLLKVSIENCIGKVLCEEVSIDEINNAVALAISEKRVVRRQLRHSIGVEDFVLDIYVASLSDDDDESLGAVLVLNDISELEHLERIRRDFVANASHELKTPITVIRGLAETILDNPTMGEKLTYSLIEKIHTQSLRLAALITDLMTISRFESNQVEVHFYDFDFGDVIRQALMDASGSAEEKSITLLESIESVNYPLHGDEQAMAQMADNLIDNAIKYTPSGRQVSITLQFQDNHAIFCVEDQGIGISSQHQQRVFERFYRVDAGRSRELGGTGLGLSIVKNIIEQHHGNIHLESELGVGSKFIVQLPLRTHAELKV